MSKMQHSRPDTQRFRRLCLRWSPEIYAFCEMPRGTLSPRPAPVMQVVTFTPGALENNLTRSIIKLGPELTLGLTPPASVADLTREHAR